MKFGALATSSPPRCLGATACQVHADGGPACGPAGHCKLVPLDTAEALPLAGVCPECGGDLRRWRAGALQCIGTGNAVGGCGFTSVSP